MLQVQAGAIADAAQSACPAGTLRQWVILSTPTSACRVIILSSQVPGTPQDRRVPEVSCECRTQVLQAQHL